MSRSPRRYDVYGRAARLAYVACWATLFVLAVALVIIPTQTDPVVVKIVGVAFAIVTAFLALRALRWESIEVGPDAVVVSGVLRTQKFARKDVEAFVSVEPTMVLAVRTRTGSTIMLGEIGSVATEVADQLNSWLAA